MCKYNGWQALGFKTYQDYLISDMWKEKRRHLLSIQSCCENCGSDKNLNVHHVNYHSVGNEGKKDLKVLCYDCHKKEHKNE